MEENKPEELSELEAQYEELKEDYEKLTDEKQMISSLLIDTENS